jgi:hypothetical protein
MDVCRGHSRTRPKFSLLGAVLILTGSTLVAGCGGGSAPPAAPMHPVKGKVVPPKTGSIAGAKIVFVPNGDGDGAREASGEIQADGSFELKSPGYGDGIAEGKYKIKFESPIGSSSKGAKPSIPLNLLDEDGSGLTQVIKPDTTEVGPYDITKAAAAQTKAKRKDND